MRGWLAGVLGSCLAPALVCGGGPPATRSTRLWSPPEARVRVDMPTLAALDAAGLALWERHAQSSLAWEVREDFGCRVAARIEPWDSPDGPVYRSTIGGDYTHRIPEGTMGTRVVTGLGCTSGFGGRTDRVTHARASDPDVQLVLEDDDDASFIPQPGDTSALIVQGGAGATVEIQERSPPPERRFTAAALREVEAELAAVLARREELQRRGVLEDLVPAGSVRIGEPTLEVDDGGQPGIYLLTAWLNLGAPGEVEARVFYVGPADNPPPDQVVGHEGAELSADRVRQKTLRRVGWSDDSELLFRYQSGVTVYEGDQGEPYRARFELWFRDQDGAERELVEVERLIEGWMH